MNSKQGYIYFLTNKPNGTLYVGVTSNLVARIYQHKQKCVDGFTKKYDLKDLVYFEVLESIEEAIKREKAIKKWPRAWKVKRILEKNPTWDDLYKEIAIG